MNLPQCSDGVTDVGLLVTLGVWFVIAAAATWIILKMIDGDF